MFDLLGHNATFLVVPELDGLRLLAFTVAVIVVPPALLRGVLALVRLASKRVEWWAFCAIAGILFALFLVPAVDRARAARGFAAHLSPAPLVFAGLDPPTP